ncbi:MAG TPA: DUF2851 family protein [Ferruginibacter sp.]|nr:DUF2851 family protein [Ferruginibacter sp.]
MNEKLLQYIWQFQYYNTAGLETTSRQSLQVVHPGNLNSNQGPDFLDAKIRIDNTTWAGSIELHILSSQWKAHRHSDDTNYRNVILHVVWKANTLEELPFPTIELYDRVSNLLLSKYTELMQARRFIQCKNHFPFVNKIIVNSWIERLLVERLQEKSAVIEHFLQKNNFNWEETFWWLIARNFGSTINSDSFEKVAQSLPLKLLAKHKNQLLQLEALLLGQAGLLNDDFKEAYPVMLQKEFSFLRKKYRLQKIHIPVYFLRMRPANFPILRLAQLAALLNNSDHLFSKILEENDVDRLQQLFIVTANDYWHYHYRLDEPGGFKKKVLGSQMIHNILINTVIPIVFTYGYFNKKESYKNKALQWLEKVQPEKNSITKSFEPLGFSNQSAFDSQGLIQLKNQYCDRKRCLECAIGNAILKG